MELSRYYLGERNVGGDFQPRNAFDVLALNAELERRLRAIGENCEVPISRSDHFKEHLDSTIFACQEAIYKAMLLTEALGLQQRKGVAITHPGDTTGDLREAVLEHLASCPCKSKYNRNTRIGANGEPEDAPECERCEKLRRSIDVIE